LSTRYSSPIVVKAILLLEILESLKSKNVLSSHNLPIACMPKLLSKI